MGPVLRISGHGALTLTLKGLSAGQAAALSQTVSSLNIGAALPPAPISFPPERAADTGPYEIILIGTPDQMRRLSRFLAEDQRILPGLAGKIDSLLDNYLRSDYKIICRGKVLDLSRRTHIMGILNVTPDSFSDGGRHADAERALMHAREMAAAGADIIDIGGESTRPGAAPVSEEEELRRIIPLIERLSAELKVPISVDTYKSSVAKKAIEAGAEIVNDISGLRFSPDMADVVAGSGAAVVIMHIKGTPRDMQQNPVYDDVVDEVMAYLEDGIEIAARAGVDREKIFIDPGIGFGKTLEHNLELIRRMPELAELGHHLLVGASRKRFLGTVLGLDDPVERDRATSILSALLFERGVGIVRVHDVAGTREALSLVRAIVSA